MTGVVGPSPAHPVAEALRERRAGLAQADPTPGPAWCQAWADILDESLAALAAPVVADRPVTVVATGSYGRQQPCPRSDVDLLLLHDPLPEADLQVVVRALIYPLWDAGLTVGYAVRDRREALDVVTDPTAATGIIDGRVVAGLESRFQAVRAEALRRVRRRPARLLEALAPDDDRRREAPGRVTEALAPDLKAGAGGLRDVQTLRWAAAALVGSPGLDPLVPAGYLGALDRRRLVQAERTLLAARVALHLNGSAGGDILHPEHLSGIAARLGYRDGAADHDTAAHRAATAIALAGRTIDHASTRAWRLIRADLARGERRRGRPVQAIVDGFEVVDGVLRMPPHLDAADPEVPTRLLRALADTGAVLERASADRLRRQAEEGSWSWSARARSRFLEVLWRGRVALPAVGELDDAGVWHALLPGWDQVRGRTQRNPYHRWTVDRHAWGAAAALGDLVRREGWAAETLGRVQDREALLLGVLLHDVGKAFGEPHAQTGVPVAREIAAAMGCGPGTVDRIGRLVALHLQVPDTARRRDLSDPALVADLADEVGDQATLAALHLLAAADGQATGPGAWTGWTAQLVAEAVTKVARVLDEQNPDGLADLAAATAREAQELAPELGAQPAEVRDHLARLPSRYAAAVSPRAVVRHALMCRGEVAEGEVRTRVSPGPPEADDVPPADELDVVATDNPGWFAKVAGVLALHGGSILAADAFTRDDGLAVETFRVRRPEGAGGSWWARVEGDLAEAAAGRLAVRARVGMTQRGELARLSRRNPVSTRVTTELDASGGATIVEVRTLDRVGALYLIADAIAELSLDIIVARIQTTGHEVLDVFYVRGPDGGPLDDDQIAELRLALTESLRLPTS